MILGFKRLSENAIVPTKANSSKLSKIYTDFDGSTGFQLCARANDYPRGAADRLLRNWKINKHIGGDYQ